MVQDSVSFIVLGDEIINPNRYYERILNMIIFPLFTIWIVTFTIYGLDYFGFDQDCILLSCTCQIPQLLLLTLPLIFENTRYKLKIVFFSILASDIQGVILYFIIKSGFWEDKNIPIGCDILTEILKGTGSLIVGIAVQILF